MKLSHLISLLSTTEESEHFTAALLSVMPTRSMLEREVQLKSLVFRENDDLLSLHLEFVMDQNIELIRVAPRLSLVPRSENG